MEIVFLGAVLFSNPSFLIHAEVRYIAGVSKRTEQQRSCDTCLWTDMVGMTLCVCTCSPHDRQVTNSSEKWM
jgi:hypothetical protein